MGWELDAHNRCGLIDEVEGWDGMIMLGESSRGDELRWDFACGE